MEWSEGSEERYLMRGRANVLMRLGAIYQEYDLDDEKAYLFFKEAIQVSEKCDEIHIFAAANVALISKYFAKKKL